ncbi:ankyrin repeat domain-containing protein [Aspergillus affinis]|uniref:ankyrin repeat domain-containing protein n=1 Tax=Aspergillus affinis TaxID=1070780 RepID=UPI0022FDF3F6|nr:ankyrin [Aspergillus affinis]KAI9044107.1 ankyrin [Aspergillus affinis]
MNGTAPLALAVKKSNIDIAVMLTRAGASLNAMDNIGAAPLHEAARHGQEKMVKLLVEQNRIDINIMHTRWSQRTPLMIASSYGYTGIIRILLNAPQLNVNQECSDPQGATALILVALSSEADAVQLLLTHPAVNVNHQDHSGTTALIYAAHRGDRKVAEALLDKGADAGICQDGSGGTALNRAIDQNAIPLVELLLEQGANVHHKDAFGRSPLHSAACNGRTEIMRILLEFDKSLDVNMQDKNGKTTLHDAALCGKVDTARFLLEHGADPTIEDNHDRTPMRIAREMNEIAIMELLRATKEERVCKQPGKFEPSPLPRTNTTLSIDTPLSLWALAKSNLIEEVRARLSNDPSAEINLRDPNLGQTALHHATANDNVEMVKMLVFHGADLNIGNTWERRPLHLTALHNSAGSAEILLKAGAEIDAKDHWGHTPLMISSINRLSIATLLVSNGADISDSRLNLNKLLGLAAENGNRVAVQRLVEAGAELWRKNSLGYSPFMVAKMYNHDEIADLILELGQPSGFPTAAGLPITDNEHNGGNHSTGEPLFVPEDVSDIVQNRNSPCLNQIDHQESESIDSGQKRIFEPSSTKASKEPENFDNASRNNQHWIRLFWEQTPWIILTTLFFLIAATAVIWPQVQKISND